MKPGTCSRAPKTYSYVETVRMPHVCRRLLRYHNPSHFFFSSAPWTRTLDTSLNLAHPTCAASTKFSDPILDVRRQRRPIIVGSQCGMPTRPFLGRTSATTTRFCATKLPGGANLVFSRGPKLALNTTMWEPLGFLLTRHFHRAYIPDHECVATAVVARNARISSQ